MKKVFAGIGIIVISVLLAGTIVFAEDDYEIHMVKKGQTISGIARQYSVPLGDLLLVNNLKREDIINVGEKIKIPLKDPRRSSLSLTEKRLGEKVEKIDRRVRFLQRAVRMNDIIPDGSFEIRISLQMVLLVSLLAIWGLYLLYKRQIIWVPIELSDGRKILFRPKLNFMGTKMKSMYRNEKGKVFFFRSTKDLAKSLTRSFKDNSALVQKFKGRIKAD